MIVIRCLMLIICVFNGSNGLRDVRIIVPEAVQRGSTFEMRCLYDLEDEVLYSVKWYRGDREFCRYLPRDRPPLKVFPISGIKVQINASDAERVTIASATSVVHGAYTCEVSADEPSFQTAQVHTFLRVVDLPKSLPRLTKVKRRYRPGMKLTAECVSYNSLPAANLSFYINDQPASSEHVWKRVDEGRGNLLTAFINIQFVIRRHHFDDERLRLRCTAIIYNIYRQSTEISAVGYQIPTSSPPPRVQEVAIHTVHRFRKNEFTQDKKMKISSSSSKPRSIKSVILLVLQCVLSRLR